MALQKKKRRLYAHVKSDEMILRDHLARDRTVLANERTLLAYIRTAIAMLAAGGTLLTVFPGNLSLWVLGVLAIVLGIVVTAIGIWRFSVIASHVHSIGADSLDEPRRDETQP